MWHFSLTIFRRNSPILKYNYENKMLNLYIFYTLSKLFESCQSRGSMWKAHVLFRKENYMKSSKCTAQISQRNFHKNVCHTSHIHSKIKINTLSNCQRFARRSLLTGDSDNGTARLRYQIGSSGKCINYKNVSIWW